MMWKGSGVCLDTGSGGLEVALVRGGVPRQESYRPPEKIEKNTCIFPVHLIIYQSMLFSQILRARRFKHGQMRVLR